MNVRNIITVTAVVLIALFLVKVFDLSYPLTIRTINSNVSAEFSVTGEGKVDVVPDTAYVDAGITVENVRTAQEAQDRISEINNKIIESLKSLGIKKEDITTSNFSINPSYDYEGGPEKITGYSGNASVTVKIRKIELASRVVEAVTKAGATNVGAARFSVENPSKYREEARNKAIEDARAQAARLARSTGIKIGRIVNIVEGSSGGVEPIYSRLESKMDTATVQGAPEIEPGSQTVTSVVTLYFERK